MSNTKPHWFTPSGAAVRPIRTAAEIEAAEAHSMALRLDHVNLAALLEGRAPESIRSEYPLGYGPGQLLRGPERRAVAAFVDAAA